MLQLRSSKGGGKPGACQLRLLERLPWKPTYDSCCYALTTTPAGGPGNCVGCFVLFCCILFLGWVRADPNNIRVLSLKRHGVMDNESAAGGFCHISPREDFENSRL